MDKEFEHDPRHVVKAIFDRAKCAWATGLAVRVSAVLLSIVYILTGTSSMLAPESLILLGSIAAVLQVYSDSVRSNGESLKRKIEYHDAFGWEIPPMDFTDHLASLTRQDQERIKKAAKENYFASEESKGAKRAVQNLQESSWWSKQLSGSMATICLIIVATLIVVSIATLTIAIDTASDFQSLQIVSRVTTAFLGVIASADMLRLCWGYLRFNRKAEISERAATDLLKQAKIHETDALRLLHEYQISRNSAPILPDLVWKMRRDVLNDLWKKYR